MSLLDMIWATRLGFGSRNYNLASELGGGAESEFMFMFSIQAQIIISLIVNLEKKNIYLYEIYFCFVECGSVHTYCK